MQSGKHELGYTIMTNYIALKKFSSKDWKGLYKN